MELEHVTRHSVNKRHQTAIVDRYSLDIANEGLLLAGKDTRTMKKYLCRQNTTTDVGDYQLQTQTILNKESKKH